MYISYYNIENMTYQDKKNSIISTLKQCIKRTDLVQEKEIYNKCNDFINEINKL